MTDLMIDIESMGNGQHALMVQIGACYFDRFTGEIGDTFKRNIEPLSAEKIGRQYDGDTIYWWLSQSDEARKSIMAEPRGEILKVMYDFYNFAQDAKAVWSHASFDFVIVQETFKALTLTPLKYKTCRDIRTLVDLSGITYKNRPREGTHHDALDDCKFQVGYCVDAFKALKLKRDEE